MAKAVLHASSHSIYKDVPGVHYHFPNTYLRRLAQAVGDWVIFFEGRAGGSRGYYSVQKVARIEPDPIDPTHSYAILDPASELSFERNVARTTPDGRTREAGLAPSGGNNVSAVRLISDVDFSAIVSEGLRAKEVPEALPRLGTSLGLNDPVADFAHAPLQVRERELASRLFRDASFARQVKTAYAARCAMSGLSLRNGGGRPEVEAAHIRAVAAEGPDTVRNGLALSGTLHWMFDRGLVSVDDDCSILVAQDSIASEVADRLLVPDRKLILPDDPAFRPHPVYLAWHRREVFKG